MVASVYVIVYVSRVQGEWSQDVNVTDKIPRPSDPSEPFDPLVPSVPSSTS